jgi:hypothetical protein
MKKLFYFILLIISISAIIPACSEEEDCSMTVRPMLNCNIYRLELGEAVKDTLDSLTVTALGTDSVILNREKKVTKISLPLRYAVDSTVFVFQYTTILFDTITVRHANTPYFISVDCGYQMQQSLERGIFHTQHHLDSINVRTPELSNNATENLKLFY